MSWGFEEGKVYNRRADIHVKFGGQQQGGIITPSQHSLVIIITGEEGLVHGYDDRTRDDGVFEYFGEGQVGDMVLQRGNLAIASHAADERVSYFFAKQKKACASSARWFTKSTTLSRHQIVKANNVMP
jgi:5-methylcytosine-specific restriction protein A